MSQSKKSSTSSVNSTYLFNNYLNQIEKNIKTSTDKATNQNIYSPKKLSDYDNTQCDKQPILQHQLRQKNRDENCSYFNFYQLDTKLPLTEKFVTGQIKQNIKQNYELQLIPNTTKNNQEKCNLDFRPANYYFSPQNKNLKQLKINYNNNSICEKKIDVKLDKRKQESTKKVVPPEKSEKKPSFEKTQITNSKQQEQTTCKLDELQIRIAQVKGKIQTQKRLNTEIEEPPKIIKDNFQLFYTSRPNNNQKGITENKEDEKVKQTSQVVITPNSTIQTQEFFSELQTVQNRTITQFRNCYLVKKLVRGCAFEQNQLMQQWLSESISQVKAIQDKTIMQKKVIKKSKLQQFNSNCLPNNDKPILIFDLDETLVHCIDCANPKIKLTDDIQIISIQTNNCKPIRVGIKLRPFARETLEELSQYFEISVFTASHKQYANQVIDYLDNKKLIKNRWFREHCNEVSTGIFVKDLSQLGLNQNQEILIVDNSIISFACQLENGIPILPFYDDNNDEELKDLTQYLKKLSQWKSIIQVNKKVFQLDAFANFNNPSALVENLFPEQFSSK